MFEYPAEIFGAKADLLQARDYAESLNEDFDDPDGAHYTVGMIKENG